MKITKKLKDELKKIATVQVVNTIESVDFAELKAQKEREKVEHPVDFTEFKARKEREKVEHPVDLTELRGFFDK